MKKFTTPDFQLLFESSPGLYLVLNPDLTIAAVNNNYLEATMTQRENITGKGLFDVFPDNPGDPAADGVRNLAASLKIVLSQARPHKMEIQRYDIRRPDGSFEERYWSPLNTPVLDENKNIIYIIHKVDDVTEFVKVKQEGEQSKKQIKESLEINQQIRAFSKHLEKAREEERTNIAREIHDELGQELTAMKMDIAWLKKRIDQVDPTIQQKVMDLSSMLDQTIKSVRRIASKLRPNLADEIGLVPAIQLQLKEFENRSGISTAFIYQEHEYVLHSTIKTGLFRIIQESLTNIAKHANAKKVTVQMHIADNKLTLIINDDGDGFDVAGIASKKTLGLLGIRERSAMMGGICEIKSEQNNGTIIQIEVPLTVNEIANNITAED